MPEKVQCPSCQKEYKWNPQLAGKRAKCKCGEVISIPMADPQAEDIGIYDVSETPPPPTPPSIPMAQTVATPVMAQRAPMAAAPNASPVMDYGRARFPGQSTPGLRNPNCCRACGSNAPTKYVEFHQNVGALVMRFHRSVKGNLCKQCIHANFWKMTMTTLAVGWLGYISIILAPIFIINNICRYIGCLGMPSAHPNSPQRA